MCSWPGPRPVCGELGAPLGKYGGNTFAGDQHNKFIGYYQWGQKIQRNRLPFSTSVYRDEGPTLRQDSGSWVWKAEWNGTLSDRLYVEARFGDFGYYFPLLTNTDAQYFWRDTGTLDITGGERRWQLDRDRLQLTGAATYFLDTGWASHTFKFGGEMLLEKSWARGRWSAPSSTTFASWSGSGAAAWAPSTRRSTCFSSARSP